MANSYLTAEVTASGRADFAWVDTAEVAPISVYASASYQQLFAEHDGSVARTLACVLNGCVVYLPVLIRELGNGRKEAYSAYGYGGFVGAGRLDDQHVNALRDFLARDGIVALFLRHAPFEENQRCLPSSLIELNRRTYAARLAPTVSFDAYLSDLPQKLRWSVNYARRAGLAASFISLDDCPAPTLTAFYRLYAELMRQKQTAAYYLFSEEFFIEHARLLGAHCELAQITHSQTGDLLATALFLIDDTGWAHYHLSAARQEAMKLQGMELLMTSAIHRYGNHGYTHLHLGGGHTLDESDGLSRFKAKFASDRLDFCCSKIVCDPAGYADERARKALRYPNFFLIADARGA